MAELVDALLSGSSAARRGGSSPLLGTTFLIDKVREGGFQLSSFADPTPFCEVLKWLEQLRGTTAGMKFDDPETSDAAICRLMRSL